MHTPLNAAKKLLGVALVTVSVVSLAACGDDDDTSGTDSTSASVDSGETTGPTDGGSDPLAGVEVIPTAEIDHVGVGETVEYPEAAYGNPPAWGTHWSPPGWADCGFYGGTIPNEAAVHSLEHGVVWLAYRPDIAADDIAVLEVIAGEEKVIVSPVDGLSAPIVATAWGVQLDVASASDPAIAAFIDEYGDSDASPEPGALCDSGVINPSNTALD
jgi:Protein of unknown function (DUF3105)